MRFIERPALDPAVQKDLDVRQARANRKQKAGELNVSAEWKRARQTAGLKSVLSTLHDMMGNRQRCMYCLDSHGADIDHFWPKTHYPDRMFAWLNLLLCCAECGRFKGDIFPHSANVPLLINPTEDDPWLDLDFDPQTGNLVARFDPRSNAYSEKGSKTVELLHLDRREALAAGHQKTYRNLSRLVQSALKQPIDSADTLLNSLIDADEYGLLNWCFLGNGRHESPFCQLRQQSPETWEHIVTVIR